MLNLYSIFSKTKHLTFFKKAIIIISLFFISQTGRSQTLFGSNLFYDGTDDYLSIAPGIVAGLSGDYTIETWVYWNGGSLSFQRILDFGNDPNNFIALTPSIPFATNGPRFAIMVGGVLQVIDATPTLPMNAWTHIAVTIEDATNTGKIYINGTLAGTNAGGITLRPSALGITTNNWLGKSEYPDPYYFGNIDELRISNSLRYTADFTPSNTPFTTDANTVALFHFDEGTGQVTADATANFPAGILGSDPTVEPIDPTWIVGGTLPIHVTEFKATPSRNSKSVLLGWDAFFDEDVIFRIERSADGNHFHSIGEVNSNLRPAAAIHFTFEDAHPLPGKNYYRVSFKENNQQTKYTKNVFVSLSPVGNVLVTPNPVTGDKIRIALPDRIAGDVLITISNMAGSVLFIKNSKVNSGNIAEITRPGVMTKGIYLLQISVKGETISGLIAFE